MRRQISPTPGITLAGACSVMRVSPESPRRRTFRWSRPDHWRDGVAALMADIVTDAVIARLRKAPPECFAWDDPSWLDRAVRKAGTFRRPNTFAVLTSRWSSGFRAVRAFHACRPDDPGTIREHGLRLPAAAWFQEEAGRLFDVPAGLIEGIVRSREIASRTGFLYLALEDTHVVRYCGHYLIRGSEALQVVARKLEEATGREYFDTLSRRGVPTIVAADVPVEAIPPWIIRELASHALTCHVESLVTGCRISRWIDFTITPVPPAWIVEHCHPTEIRDPHHGFRAYRPERGVCGWCRTES